MYRLASGANIQVSIKEVNGYLSDDATNNYSCTSNVLFRSNYKIIHDSLAIVSRILGK